MQITILGSNGKVGRIVTEIALEKGFRVNALVHSHSALDKHPNLKIYKGNIYDSKSLSPAISGSSAVVSCLSSWKSDKKDILSSAMTNLIPLLEKQKINRVISLTGADARAINDDLSLLHKLSHSIIQIVGKSVMADSEKHIKLLEDSELNYSVLRSPIMNSSGKVTYDLTDVRPMPWATINRNAVALAMINLLQIDDYKRRSIYIVR
jgi:putative NADH-flavin reductase